MTKLKPSQIFERLNLSALDNVTAEYVKTQLVNDPDIDLLEGTEIVDAIIELLKESFPDALINLPKDIGEEITITEPVVTTPVVEETPAVEEEVIIKPETVVETEKKEPPTKAQYQEAIDILKGLIPFQKTAKEKKDYKEAIAILQGLKSMTKFSKGGRTSEFSLEKHLAELSKFKKN